MTKNIANTSWPAFTAVGGSGTYNSWEPDGVSRTRIASPEFTFTDDFEGSEDTSFWNSGTRSAYGVAATNDSGYTGGNVMSMAYQAAALGQDSFSEKRFLLANPAVQVEIVYDIFVPANYIHRDDAPNNNKLFAIWGDGDGSISGSEIGMISECQRAAGGQLGSYPDLAMGGAGTNYDHTGNFDGSTPRVYKENDGNWHQIGVYIELAQGAGQFGKFEIWRDDELLISNQQDLDISVGASGVPSSEHIPFNSTYNFLDEGYIMGWANSGFSAETIFYIDNFTIKTRSSSVGATI